MNVIFNLILFTAVLPLSAAFCPSGFTGLSCTKYNLAYQKSASQKEEWMSHSADFAVDSNQTTCTVMNPPVENPWWSVDLGKEMLVQGMDLYVGQEAINQIRSYTVEVQRSDGNWSMCNSYSGGALLSPISVVCRNTVIGHNVKFTVYANLSLVLCDVGVYGACVDGSYGNYCENGCGSCKLSAPVCDKFTGRCPLGCEVGWNPPLCKDICPSMFYGDQCAQRCGQCLYNVTCTRFTGECPSNGECQPGYLSPMCQQQCPNGQWGLGCVKCGACKSQPCDKIMGVCSGGCAPGYKPQFVSNLDPVNYNPLCNITCDYGRYGTDCAFECGFCKDSTESPATCNLTTGRCDVGCALGYKDDSNTTSAELQCRTECVPGKYGNNCLETCGECARTENNTLISSPCEKDSGSCPFGCLPGYQGVKCADVCSPGTYGTSCGQSCGKCKDGDNCDILNGTCPGDCENGYLGNMCKQECPAGTFGFQCKGKCPVNCANNCQFTDGSCICKDGWTGSFCQQVCPNNFYGKDCKFPCSGNCVGGTTCNQTTGNCDKGCTEEWTGLKCDTKKIIEKFERSYADVIGGVIGGVIALGLIIAFIVWIVWRYRKDKDIHIKALASSIRGSIRRLSIRGRDSLRRSVQRLSMRGRGAQDQQKLGKDIEGPAQTNGNKGGRRHVPRMYDCVKLQSNQIHYDDFPRIYLQLQEATPDGRTLLYDSFQSFMAQRPRDDKASQNGHSNNKSYYNAALEDVNVEMDSGKSTKIPAFLPLGSNLSGFLLINAPAASDVLWNHLQQRQIATIISIGKEASFVWQPGERITIGHDIVECIDVQLYTSHKETKLTVQRMGTRGRRAVRHLECYIWNQHERFPLIPTLIMFMEQFQQITYQQRERIILVNYLNLHDQAILFTLVASALEILAESKKADILRTVAIGGNATLKSVRTFDEFKYLHDVIFQYITSMENRHSSTAI